MSERRFLLRCDAGAEHGLGHLSRALVVARAIAAAGLRRPEFLVAAPDAILARVRAEGFEISPAPGSVGSPAGRAWLAQRIESLPRDSVLTFDSKQVDAAIVEACNPHLAVACFGDEVALDLPSRLIVNNHPWANAAEYGVRPNRRLLLGPRYNTIDPAYFEQPAPGRRGVLISLGGEDPGNHTAWLAECLADRLRGIPVRIVIGPAHPAPDAARDACARHIPHAHVDVAPATLVTHARACHIALSAGGTSCYEFAAAGMAIGAVAVEPHQERLVAALAKLDVAVRIAGPADRDPGPARRFIDAMLAGNGDAARQGEWARKLFAGPGAPLVAEALAAL
jgi:spore coat polysaccharide biosynthesis predicted glycosyltransferase SpsG